MKAPGSRPLQPRDNLPPRRRRSEDAAGPGSSSKSVRGRAGDPSPPRSRLRGPRAAPGDPGAGAQWPRAAGCRGRGRGRAAASPGWSGRIPGRRARKAPRWGRRRRPGTGRRWGREARPPTFAIVHGPSGAVSPGDWQRPGSHKPELASAFRAAFATAGGKESPGTRALRPAGAERVGVLGAAGSFFLPPLGTACGQEAGAPQPPPWRPPQALGGPRFAPARQRTRGDLTAGCSPGSLNA